MKKNKLNPRAFEGLCPSSWWPWMNLCYSCSTRRNWKVSIASNLLHVWRKTFQKSFLCLDWKLKAQVWAVSRRISMKTAWLFFEMYKHKNKPTQSEYLRGIIGREFPRSAVYVVVALISFSGNSPCFRFFKFSFPFNSHRCCSPFYLFFLLLACTTRK